MSFDTDFTIIGGGIIGLLTGIRLQKIYPESSVVIVEKELYLGEHTSSRNSGVLHSGIYYETNSLKHKLCLEGQDLWSPLFKDNKIPWKKTGKFIFAATDSELSNLISLEKQANLNGVEALSLTQSQRVYLANVVHNKEALFIPSTGIIDAAEAIKTLQRNFEMKGGIVLKSHQVSDIERKDVGFHLKFFQGEAFTTNALFNCAGLESVHIRKKLGLENLSPYFVKGYYIKYLGQLPVEQLIYPIPPNNQKGLGVHLTLDWNGSIKFGPNTEDVSDINYDLNSSEQQIMMDYILSTYKNIDQRKLFLDYSGIRPKIKCHGELYRDFWIKGAEDLEIPNYVESCGIESPGLTSAPAIAKMLVDKLQ